MMALWSRLFNRPSSQPQAATQSSTGGVVISTPYELEQFLRKGGESKSGALVTVDTAMQVAAVYGCVRIICGSVATLPLDIKRKVDDRTRVDASDTELWKLIRRRPNRWQKPAQFRRMLQAHVLLRGNAFCHKVMSRGTLIELIPLNPDSSRMKVTQNPDLSLKYEYRRADGGTTTFRQEEIFHLYGLSLDGITGVTPLTYARETIGDALSMAEAGASTFRSGPRIGGILKTAQALSEPAIKKLQASLDDYRLGGDREGKFLILEEGLEPTQIGMSAQDAQWIEGRKFSRTDIAMFFGVPPFMLGDTEKSTSWGAGISQQKDGFVAFTLDDHLTMWEEGITIDLNDDPKIYARFNRNAFVKGDIAARWTAYTQALQWGVYSPNKVLELEDENPRPGGDIYYPPPNTAGKSSDAKGASNDNSQTA